MIVHQAALRDVAVLEEEEQHVPNYGRKNNGLFRGPHRGS